MTIGAVRATMLGAAGGGGAEFFVGEFDLATATGTQSITGVGFKPKAIIFWGTEINGTAETREDDLIQSYGITSGPGEEFATCQWHDTNDTGFDIRHTHSASAALITVAGTGGTQHEASLDSFDADGFTLDYISANSNLKQFYFLAIGGSSVQAKLLSWNVASTTTGLESVTGAGFEPSGVIHLSGLPAVANTNSGVDGSQTLSAMDGTGEWAINTFGDDGGGFGFYRGGTSGYSQPAKAISNYDPDPDEEINGIFDSMDSDGFTVNIQLNEVTGVTYFQSLCLTGFDIAVGTFTPDGSTIGDQSFTGVGFEPEILLVAAHVDTTTDTRMSIGATDGTNEKVMSWHTQGSADPSRCYTRWEDGTLVATFGRSDTIDDDASLTSFDADGFTLNFVENDNASPFYYLAMKS